MDAPATYLRTLAATLTAVCTVALSIGADAPARAQADTQASQASSAAVAYALDPAKSALEYEFVQAGAKNKGRFNKFTVSLALPASSADPGRLTVTIDMRSLNTGDQERDGVLGGSDLFDVAKYPQAQFSSSRLMRTATGFDAIGKLTIRGVTRDAHVPFAFRTVMEGGKPAGYLTGRMVVKRLDFGIGQGDWKSTEWVGNDVTVLYSLRVVPAG